MGSIGGPKITTNGLVLHLDAANPKSYIGSGTEWDDLTDNDNNGVLINATFDSGNNGNILFDGSGDYMTITPITTNSIYTLEFWYKMGGNDGGYGYFASDETKGFAISEGGTAAGLSYGEFYYYNGGASAIPLADIPSTTDWNNISAIIDTTTDNIEVYGNGLSISNTTVTNISTSINTIGKYNTTSHYLKGNLAIYKIYNGALSGDEILQNYNAIKNRFNL